MNETDPVQTLFLKYTSPNSNCIMHNEYINFVYYNLAQNQNLLSVNGIINKNVYQLLEKLFWLLHQNFSHLDISDKIRKKDLSIKVIALLGGMWNFIW